MKYLAGVILVLILIAGVHFMATRSDNGAAMMQQDTATGPLGKAGINGSVNQGNLGQPDSGIVQNPGSDGADGTVIDANLALGVDGAAGKTHLIGYNGMTMYTYANDTDGKSVCIEECAANWPPYIVGPEDNLSHIQAGVTGKVSTFIRANGNIQVTYNGKPLYFYLNDKAPGETTGDKIGNVWFVATP